MSNKGLAIIGSIISMVLAVKLFEGSIWMFTLIYGVFLLYIREKKEEWKYEKKYLIARGISTVGLLVLIIGNLIRNDLLIIIGAALAACTLAPLIIIDFHYYYKKHRS